MKVALPLPQADEWGKCPRCKDKKIPRRYKPELPFADTDGWIELPCVVCDARDYRLAAELLSPMNTAIRNSDREINELFECGD